MNIANTLLCSKMKPLLDMPRLSAHKPFDNTGCRLIDHST